MSYRPWLKSKKELDEIQARRCKLCGLDSTVISYDACIGYVKKCGDACRKGYNTSKDYFIHKEK